MRKNRFYFFIFDRIISPAVSPFREPERQAYGEPLIPGLALDGLEAWIEHRLLYLLRKNQPGWVIIGPAASVAVLARSRLPPPCGRVRSVC